MPISFLSPASLMNTFLTIDTIFWNKAHEVSSHQELGSYLPLTSSDIRRAQFADNYLSCNPAANLPLGLRACTVPVPPQRCNITAISNPFAMIWQHWPQVSVRSIKEHGQNQTLALSLPRVRVACMVIASC